MARQDFTPEEKKILVKLVAKGLTYPEIAKEMNRSRNSVCLAGQRLGIVNDNYMKRKTKHKHLREPAMKYFLNHSLEETQKKFNLTRSEIKSLFTVGYRDPELKHLRKDTRRHDHFTETELRTILKFSGILNRQQISEIIGRDGARVIKEKLSHLKISSRNVNGINITQFTIAFGKRPFRYVQGNAGPATGGKNPNHFGIVLWVDLLEMIESKDITASKVLVQVTKVMALFQEWVWGTKDVYRKMNQELRRYL